MSTCQSPSRKQVQFRPSTLNSARMFGPQCPLLGPGTSRSDRFGPLCRTEMAIWLPMLDFRICFVSHRIHTNARLGVLVLGGYCGWIGEARQQFIYIVGFWSIELKGPRSPSRCCGSRFGVVVGGDGKKYSSNTDYISIVTTFGKRHSLIATSLRSMPSSRPRVAGQ